MLIVFDEFYKLSMKCLRMNGAHPALARDWRWALRFSLLHGYFTAYATFCSLHLILVDVTNRDLPNACSNGIFVMVYFVVSVQYAVMVFYQEKISILIKYQDANFAAAQSFSEEDQNIIYDYAKRGRMRSNWWFYSTITTLLMFPVKGTIQAIHHYFKYQQLKLFPINGNVYPSAIEQHRDNFVVFVSLYFLFFLYGFYCIMMYTGFTPLAPLFMLNACAQVELAIKQALQIFADAEFNQEESTKRIKKLIKDMNHIYAVLDIVNEIFSLLFELYIKTAAFMIPVSFFLIIWVWNNTGELATDYIMFAFTASTLSFEICYYADIVMEKSEELRQAIYASSWEKHFDSNLRKTLIIMLIRTLSPMAIKTPFRPICLDTFSDMCSESYTIFNVMNAALM